MRLLHFEVSPGLRNDSIVTLAYLWQGQWEASGVCGLRNHTTNIWPLPHDQLPGKISALYCKIINKLQLLTLCLLFWVNGADHLTFDGEGGMMVFLIMQDHFAAKPTSVMGFFFLIFRCKYKTINSRQSLSLFQVFLQNYLPFFFFFFWNHAIPHCTPSKVQWPDLSYTVTLRLGATELSISIDRWQVTLHISIVIVAIWQHAALFQKAKVTSQHYYILHSLAFSKFPCDWKNCWEKQYVKNLVEDFKEARQTQERERQFMVSQIYLHKRLRLIPQGFEIFLLDRPFSESVEVFHFVLFTWLEGVK